MKPETQKFVNRLSQPERWPCPLPVDRLLHKLSYNQRYDDTECTAEELHTITKDLIKKGYSMNQALGMYLEAVFDIRNLLDKHPNVSAYTVEKVVNQCNKILRKSAVTPGESVGSVAAQSIGEVTTQLTLNSVDYRTDLVIRWKGYIKSARNDCIGKLIDDLLGRFKDQVQTPERDVSYLPLPEGLAEALTIDEDGKVSWKALEAVTRHPPKIRMAPTIF